MKPNLNDKYYLLKEMEKEEKQSQRELAKVLGFSLGKLNFVLKALIFKGLVKMEKFVHSEQKIQYRYILTLDGIKEKFRSQPPLSSASKRSIREFCRKSTKLARRFPHEQRS
jgi:DNA-binding Lrp family transcriptional regulator